jgi:hypothetical protein
VGGEAGNGVDLIEDDLPEGVRNISTRQSSGSPAPCRSSSRRL